MTTGVKRREEHLEQGPIQTIAKRVRSGARYFVYPVTHLKLESRLQRLRAQILEQPFSPESQEDIEEFKTAFCITKEGLDDVFGFLYSDSFRLLKVREGTPLIGQTECPFFKKIQQKVKQIETDCFMPFPLPDLPSILNKKLSSQKFCEGIEQHSREEYESSLLSFLESMMRGNAEMRQKIHQNALDSLEKHANTYIEGGKYEDALSLYLLFFAINDKMCEKGNNLLPEEKERLQQNCAKIYCLKGDKLQKEGDSTRASRCFLRSAALKVKREIALCSVHDHPIKSLDSAFIAYLMNPSEDSRKVLADIQQEIQEKRRSPFVGDRPMPPEVWNEYVGKFLDYPGMLDLQKTCRAAGKLFPGDVKEEAKITWNIMKTRFFELYGNFLGVDHTMMHGANWDFELVQKIHVVGKNLILLQTPLWIEIIKLSKERNLKYRIMNSLTHPNDLSVVEMKNSSQYALLHNARDNKLFLAAEYKHFLKNLATEQDREIQQCNTSWKFYENREGISAEFKLVNCEGKMELLERETFSEQEKSYLVNEELKEGEIFLKEMSKDYLLCSVNLTKKILFSRNDREKKHLPDCIQEALAIPGRYAKIIGDYLYVETRKPDTTDFILISYYIPKETSFSIEFPPMDIPLILQDLKKHLNVLYAVTERALIAYDEEEGKFLYVKPLSKDRFMRILYLNRYIIVLGFSPYAAPGLSKRLEVYSAQTGETLRSYTGQVDDFSPHSPVQNYLHFSTDQIIQFVDDKNSVTIAQHPL